MSVSPTVATSSSSTTTGLYEENGDIFSRLYQSVSGWIGKKVMATMKYRHCEIAFEIDLSLFTKEQLQPVDGIPYNANTLVAYGTNLKVKQIFRMPRTFEQYTSSSSSSPGYHRHDHDDIIDRLKVDRSYEWIHLNVPIYLAKKVVDFCEGELGKGYDKSALERLMVLPKGLETNSFDWKTKQKWHCTNFCVVALQQAGFLTGLDPNILTADDVYSFLEYNKYRKTSYRTPISMRKARVLNSIKHMDMLEQQY
jgi:hypothetical protein